MTKPLRVSRDFITICKTVVRENKSFCETAGLEHRFIRGVEAPPPEEIRVRIDEAGMHPDTMQIIEASFDTGTGLANINARAVGPEVCNTFEVPQAARSMPGIPCRFAYPHSRKSWTSYGTSACSTRTMLSG